jgi:hypothetical protein
MRRVSISVLFRLGLLGLLAWVAAIAVASIAPLWAYVGVRATTLLVPALVAVGFAALFLGLLCLLAASTWACGAFVHRRLRRPTI